MGGYTVPSLQRTVWKFLIKLSTYISYYPAILLCIYPRQMKANVHKNTHRKIFIAILFTKIKNWKHLQYPSRVEWTKSWYIHTMKYQSTIKENLLIHNNQRKKQPKCPSTDEWINKTLYTYMMEYFSALKKKLNSDMLQHVCTLKILH